MCGCIFIIIFFAIIITATITMLIAHFFIYKPNSNNSNSISPQNLNSNKDFILEYEYFYNSTKEDYSQKSYHDGYYKINQTAKYKICIYGAKVFNGRRGEKYVE